LVIVYSLILLLLLLLSMVVQGTGRADVWQQLICQCAKNELCQPLVTNQLFEQVAGQQQQLAQQEQSIEQLQQENMQLQQRAQEQEQCV
jgi:TolA-binding protein